MSTIKHVSGPYTINTINRVDPITLDADMVIVNGNLQVYGNTLLGQTVAANIQQTYVTDNIIRLNAGWTDSDNPVLDAGLEVNRGNQPDVSIIWNESSNQWQLTNNGTLFSNIVATSTGVTKLNEDPAPELSANLNVGPNWTVSNTSIQMFSPTVSVDSRVALKIYETGPAAIPHYNILHSGNVSAGGTGLYVTAGEQNVVNEELISKKRAIVYSIIF
jgi:hypothetical protein